MKILTAIATILLFTAVSALADSISTTVDANGNIVFTNSGPSQQDIQQREERTEGNRSSYKSRRNTSQSNTTQYRQPRQQPRQVSNSEKRRQEKRHRETVYTEESKILEAQYKGKRGAGSAPGYNAARAKLVRDPIKYREDRLARDRARANRREEEASNPPAIINGEWDSQGRHYTPAGGGNAWRDDGTFMQKAAGGYIDTKTGQFVPAN